MELGQTAPVCYVMILWLPFTFWISQDAEGFMNAWLRLWRIRRPAPSRLTVKVYKIIAYINVIGSVLTLYECYFLR